MNLLALLLMIAVLWLAVRDPGCVDVCAPNPVVSSTIVGCTCQVDKVCDLVVPELKFPEDE